MDAIMQKLCPKADGRFGAPMGRRSWGRDLTGIVGPFYIRKIKLDSGGYDSGGAYWGLRMGETSLYGYLSHDGNVSGFFDAKDQKDALTQLRAIHPAAKRAR